MEEAIKVTNFSRFKKALVKIIGDESFNKIIDQIGGVDSIKNSPYTVKNDIGLGESGTLLSFAMNIIANAENINKNLPDNLKVDIKSIYKVVLISIVSKACMFEPNDNEWEKRTLGKLWKFKESGNVMKFNERSILIATNAGVSFSEDEFEAMLNLNSDTEDNKNNFFSCLTFIINSAINTSVFIQAKLSDLSKRK